MNYIKITAVVIGIILLTFFPRQASPASEFRNIRVSVAGGKEKLLLSVKGRYSIEAINSRLILDEGRSIKTEDVVPTNSGLKIGGKEFRLYGVRIIPAKDAAIYINDMRFRGIVDIIRSKELNLLVVNHLDVEKYLYGVLYHESPHYWPLEALKAQAVVARTFALYRVQTMRERDFDVTSDIFSQVYGGKESERRRTMAAVDATKGMVLTYNGAILPAYYHSTCAGHTEDAKSIFDIDLPPLKGTPCPYCRDSRNMYWKEKFSYKQIEERLNKYGIKAKDLSFIIEGKRDKSGRLETVRIRDREGIKEINGFKFRLALGPNIIKSTNFTINISPEGILFDGRGWGHGVGMCQWGAYGMAARGFGYEEILRFYYPGAEISRVPAEL
jgi:stage II sporulation protein D